MEVKQEIYQIIDNLPEGVMEELLQYLREVEKVNKEEIQLSTNLKNILNEDRELLQRLAK